MSQRRTWVCADCGRKHRNDKRPASCGGCGCSTVVRQDGLARRQRERRRARRWPIEPLMEATDLSAISLQRLLGGSAARRRSLTDEQADRAACHFGLHPVMVWGWEWVTVGLMHADNADDVFENLRAQQGAAA